MQQTEALRTFIRAHSGDDLPRLLLSAARYPDVDVPFAVIQIAARRHIREKLPSWFANDYLLFPSLTAAEQCSSEQTARYKLRMLRGEKHLCDLTGGLGVDTFHFAQKMEQVTYVEAHPACFEAAMHNFSVLSAGNIRGIRARAEDVAERITADIFYLDPSRRRDGSRRVHALQDCDPDLLKLRPALLKRAPAIISKLSPMLDLRHTLETVVGVAEIHVVSVKNECRELLLLLKNEKDAPPEPEIYCTNITADGEQVFRFFLSEEYACAPRIASRPGTYLYEPNASVLKAGAYKLTAQRTNTCKLHRHSHLYTSDVILSDFPGRAFRVEDVIPFHAKNCKTIARDIPQANLSVRNFPLTAEALRQRTRIADGGDIYLFATTLAPKNEKVWIRCRKLPRFQ